MSLHNVIPDDCTYLTALFEAGWLIDTGVLGLYGRNKVFEDVVERVSALIGRWGQGKQVEVLRFPPAMSRAVLEESGHWRNFPEQIGAVFGFCGDDLNHQRLLKCLDRQEDWAEHLDADVDACGLLAGLSDHGSARQFTGTRTLDRHLLLLLPS